MRKNGVLLVFLLTVFLVACEVHIPEDDYASHTLPKHKKSETRPTTNYNDGQSNSKQSGSVEFNPEDANLVKLLRETGHKVRHHHGTNPSGKPPKSIKTRKGRCKRNPQRYYQPYQNMPVYVPNDQNYLAPNYVPPQYIVPSHYAMCRSYCIPCITSTCRRRCPNFPGTTTTTITKTSSKPTATITVVTKPPCNCDENGSIHQNCDSTGACQCKPNYTGHTCSICKDGFWKNGNRECVECNCNRYGSVPNTFCDKNTGRCHCKEGVQGTTCNSCRPPYYGLVERGCQTCNCDQNGSVDQNCDSTGTCQCKPNFTGRTCNICKDGFWKNGNGDCVECNCNRYGSVPNTFCDKNTGRCHCREGVYGITCDSCKPPYFGLVERGCQVCNCNEDGSKYQTCDSTGACRCKPNYTGKTCDSCKDGFWKNKNKDCVECNCNKYGSASNTYCDKNTGRCYCKEGVEGFNCDSCKPRHYGSIENGCKACDPCDKAGHICDPQNGKCICPTLTEGENCEYCMKHSWGFEPGTGCKACQCSATGSSSLQCDAFRGTCQCKIGYEGEKCNKCSVGYYGYPNCKKCNCDKSGTVEEDCTGDNCRCSDNGNCRCKENVSGTKCDGCKPSTFGLAKDNPKGCTTCFCFGRSDQCEEAHFYWDKVRTDRTNDKTEIVTYWSLPNQFMGDLTSSYGGYLTVELDQGNFSITLEGNGVRVQSSSSTHELQLVENNWNIVFENPKFPYECQTTVTRSCFMVVLQNVDSLVVTANNRIRQVLLDRANPDLSAYPSTHSIEKCECPKEYTGLSCQDPNVGYFRFFSYNPNDNWIDLVIGKAKPCDCNGNSKICDPNTGFCKNCTGNTSGRHCELCDIGYYKDINGKCLPCLCPTAEQNNAESCSPIENSFKCNCKKGYKGQFCEKCDSGYFDKDPSTYSVICEPCNCNPFGVINGERGTCNQFGICQCKEGFKGDKCDQCANEREYINNGVCSPCDECVKLLFSEIDNLTLAVEDTFSLFNEGVQPPWNKLTTTIDKHGLLSKKFKNKKKQVDNLLKNVDIDLLEDEIDNMQGKLKNQKGQVEENIRNTKELQNNANELIDKIEKLSEKLVNTIETLENFATKPVSIENALKKARAILKQINAISERFKKQEDEEALHYCANITKRVNDIYKPPSDIPKQLLEELNSKLDDIISITASVENSVNKADKMNVKNTDRIKKFKEKIEKLKNDNRGIENSVQEIMDKINATDDLIQSLEILHDDLRNISDSIEYKQLEHRIRRQMKDNDANRDLLQRVMDHVKELENKIDSYRSIFNFTKDEWTKINASGAYEALINGIKEAQKDVELSRQLLEDATKLISPKDSEGVIDKSNLAREYSEKLKERLQNLKDVSKSLKNIKKQLNQFKYSLLDSGKANNDLNQILHNMQVEITSQADTISKLEESIKNNTIIADNMEQIKKKIQEMLTSSQDNFFNKYNIYLNLTSKEEIEKLKTKLTETRKHLENIDVKSTDFDDIKNFNAENKNKNLKAIQEKFEELKNKINYAKQAADTISVAMNISNCRMLYQLPQMEVLKSLSITFKCETCQLFKLSSVDGEFNLAVKNNDILLTFNDKNIIISNTGKDKEKTINIEKLGALIKIQVETVEKSEVTDSLYYIIHPTDYIEIGSTNNKDQKQSYIYSVILNQRKFGLWKFSKTEGNCTGETRDESDKQPENVNTFFNGKGYMTYGKNNKLNPSKLSLGLDFNTFDENSLIYLASIDENKVSKEDTCAYIMLFLKNGYLNLIIQHSNGLNGNLALTSKSNNGRKHHVDINMEYDKSGIQYYILFAKNETFVDKTNSTNILNKKNVFKIKQASHFVGGVPPVFNKTCIPFNKNFLGFLKLTTPLTNEILSYGTTKTDRQDLQFYQVWVNKDGYVNLKLTDQKVKSISFILQPASPNGLIMNLGEYKITLNNYKLKIIGFKNEHGINSDKDEYNTVNISLTEGSLIVNKDKKDILSPSEINIDDLVLKIGDNSEGFNGGLSNIMINNKELLFTPDSVIEFTNVEIGREPPAARSKKTEKSVKSLSPFMMNSIQTTERCARPPYYEIIPDALKFGDTSNSYTHIKTNFWKNDYIISFQFRTFYPNGILFISVGNQKQQHYNLLKLTEGQLSLHVKGRKNKSPIILSGKLNNGEWHKVEIMKRKRKITITLDGEHKKNVKVPKTLVRNEIFFGGVPTDSKYLTANGLGVLNPFRGCLRSVTINDEHQLVKNKDVHHSNTGQCFSQIEEGAYFNGTAFAIFEETLKVDKALELNFEFRTTEQNGILLSIPDPEHKSGLSVELQNRAIVLTVMGDGTTSNVKNNPNSNFALCNNAWHNVTAIYSGSELTVFVDGIFQTWAQSVVNSFLDRIDTPVYIGGIPDTTPTSKSKNKFFKGCLRNIKIENKLIDWSNLKRLHNVLLNSCPV